MIRGITLFICTECKKVFWAPDVEYDAMVYSVPMPCERCGSIRTMPMKLDPFHSDKLNPNKPLEKQLCYYSIYESIWKRIGRPDIDGTPDEQYRTGMMFLNGEAWSMPNSEVAFYWFMKAAKRGHAQAQYQVGAMLDRVRYRYKYDKYLENPPFCCTPYVEGTVYQWISKAVEQGLPEAMCYLGNMYRMGNSVEKDFKKAFEWHQKAIMSGCVESEYALGCMYERGEGVLPDLHEAVRWYKEAAKHGYVKAQLHLGRVYESTGKERDYQEAFFFYQQAAQHKSAEAWQRLASLYETGKGVEQDFLKAWECYLSAWEAGSEEAYKKAKRLLDEGLAHPEISALKEWYRKCIAQGYREMWYDLGKLYDEGKEEEGNLEEAFRCYRIAARTAHVAEAQYILGCRYEQGEGVPPDLHEATRWYKEAAKQGHQKSVEICLRLASLYEMGKGVEQNFQEAWECYLIVWNAGSEKAYKEIKRLWNEGRVDLGVSTEKEWCRKWIAQGHKEFWYDLGKLYEEGKEGERDLEEAFRCYGIAARTAHVSEAQYALGCMYEQGEGIQPDLQKALHWYKEAANQGHTEAQAACRWLADGDSRKQ